MIAVFLVGLYYGKNTKTTNEYAVANRRYGKFVLTMTFVATSFGAGSTVGDAAKVASDGIIFIISMVGAWGMAFYTQHYAGKYFDSRFENMISAGDVSRYFYGIRAEQITALLGLLVSATTVGAQLTAIGHLFSHFLAINYRDIVIISAIVVIIYVSFGGIKAVATTDVVQFIIIVTVIPCMGWWLVKQSGGITNVFQNADPAKFMVFSHPKFTEYAFLFFCSWLPFLWINPALFQRFLMAKNVSQVKAMYRTELVMRVFFCFMMVLIGLSASQLFPGIAPKNLISAVVNNSLPEGMRGLFIVAVLAASMSTADSALNTATILLTHNLLCRNNHDEKLRINLMRLLTVVIGLISLYVALHDLEIIELILTGFSVWGGGVMVPVIGAVIRLPTPRYAFFVPAVVAIIVSIACQIIGVKGFLTPSLTVLASLFSYIAALIYHRLMPIQQIQSGVGSDTTLIDNG